MINPRTLATLLQFAVAVTSAAITAGYIAQNSTLAALLLSISAAAGAAAHMTANPRNEPTDTSSPDR